MCFLPLPHFKDSPLKTIVSEEKRGVHVWRVFSHSFLHELDVKLGLALTLLDQGVPSSNARSVVVPISFRKDFRHGCICSPDMSYMIALGAPISLRIFVSLG